MTCEVGTLGRWDVGRWTLNVGLDVIMRTVTNHAMMTHDHLCSPTNFVDNCSYVDFVITGYVLNATIEWRVSEDDQAGVSGCSFVCVCVSVFGHKHEKSASLYVPLTASLWVSAGFCLSLSSCLRLSLSLSVSVFLCLSLSACLGLSVCLSVRLSVCLFVGLSVRLSVSVCLGLVLVAKKCLLVCVSVPAIPGTLTTTQSKEKAPWMTMDDEARDENNTQDCGCCGLQTL